MSLGLPVRRSGRARANRLDACVTCELHGCIKHVTASPGDARRLNTVVATSRTLNRPLPILGAHGSCVWIRRDRRAAAGARARAAGGRRRAAAGRDGAGPQRTRTGPISLANV